MRKKTLVWILTIVMIAAFMPITSFGAQTGGDEDVAATEQEQIPELQGAEDENAQDAEAIEKEDAAANEQGQEPQGSVIDKTEDFEGYVCEADVNPGLRKAADDDMAELMQRKAAHLKIRQLLHDYADFGYYERNVPNNYPAQIKEDAEAATANCTSDYDKMKAVYDLITDNMFYDYDAYALLDQGVRTEYETYEAWVKTKITDCSGYADTCYAMLNSIGIPCIKLESEMHLYNAAYDSDRDTWVFLDTTWGSKNRFENGQYVTRGYTNYYFDMSAERLANLLHHEILSIPRESIFLTIAGSNATLYLYSTIKDDQWANMDAWELRVVGPTSTDVETVNITKNELCGIPITRVFRSNVIYSNGMNKRLLFFNNRTSLKHVTLPDSITKIDEYAFNGCTALETINIPRGVTQIERHTFDKCTSLEQIAIPEGVESIDSYVFYQCAGLKSIEISSSCTTFGNSMFAYCSALDNVVIPEGTKSIPASMFSSCTSLKNITLPNSLETIGSSVFSSCTALENIEIPEGVRSMGVRVFYYCENLTNVSLPNGLESIPDYTFCNSSSRPNKVLEDIVIPEGVTSIGKQAFCYCQKTRNLYIPDSLTSIANDAFERCLRVQVLYCNEGSCAIPFADSHSNVEWRLKSSIADEPFVVNLTKTDYHTTGETIKPQVEVKHGDTVLTEGVDYSVSKSMDAVGETSATVKGIGHYGGTVEVEFTIEDHQAGEYIKDPPATCLEDGKEVCYCTICGEKIDERTLLSAGHHEWSEPLEDPAGLLKNGKKYVECEVCHEVEVEEIIPGWAKYYVKGLKVTAGTKAITIKWKKQSKSNQKKFNGYQIQYSTKADMSNAQTKTAKKSSKGKTIKKLKKNKKYYVQVRTYTKTADGTFYSKWSKKRTVKTK